MNQWLCEWVVRWTNASVNQWITGWVNQRIKECNANKPKNQWIHESMNEGMDGWMNGWMGEVFFLLSYFFTERPLCCGTSSLSYFFSEQPLIWATSARSSCVASATQVFSSRSCYTMRLAASSCNPASHRSSAMVKNYLSRSCYNAFSNFQLQSRLLAASLASLMLCWFCHSRLQTRKIHQNPA